MSESILTPEQYAEIAAAVERGDAFTESGIHINYGDSEDQWAAQVADELQNGTWERVPPGYAIVRDSDRITPLLLEAMRAVMQIVPIDQLSDAHLDELVYAIRGTTNPETWSEDQP